MTALTSDFVERFWRKDGTLWSGGKYGDAVTGFLGWLDSPRIMSGRVAEIRSFASGIKERGAERAILAGMGGSSLAPLVLGTCLGNCTGVPLDILDSTDPGTMLRVRRAAPLTQTTSIIASKSGGTAEPNAFNDYLYDQAKGEDLEAGQHFAAITDPGSPFEERANSLGFRNIFLNFPDIGGRYSALSYFGLVPAAAAGVDIAKLLDRAEQVRNENEAVNGPDQAEAFKLGAELGSHALGGRDKLTFLTPPELSTLGLWMEQLIAESTGKGGKGILPIALEEVGQPADYGLDRVFAVFQIADRPDRKVSNATAELKAAGFPVYEFLLNDWHDLGGEFMRWEIATAVAGSVIGINPFDQPNVQESKDITKRYVAELETRGELPSESPDVSTDGLSAYGCAGNTVMDAVGRFLSGIRKGDYICLQAYLTETEETDHALGELQRRLRNRFKTPVTRGYGPRFLHSTGQFHKGGPNTGHFIQLTQDDLEDVPIPGHTYTFGGFRNAQTLGDRDALKAHGRRVIRVHLGADPSKAIQALTAGTSA